MIIFWLLFDIYGAYSGIGSVAYFAHLGGFGFGVIFALLALKFGLIEVERGEVSLPQSIKDKFGSTNSQSKRKFNKSTVKKTHLPQKTLTPKVPNSERVATICQDCGVKMKVKPKMINQALNCPKCGCVTRLFAV